MFPTLAGRFLTTGGPRKSLDIFLNVLQESNKVKVLAVGHEDVRRDPDDLGTRSLRFWWSSLPVAGSAHFAGLLASPE